MKAATASLHDIAETSGAVKDIIDGTISRGAYSLYLRNLLPIYSALEDSEMIKNSVIAKSFITPDLYRAPHIRADLETLMPEKDWRALPLLEPARAYISDIQKAGQNGQLAILGHIYVRYLGDLHGGQILKTILGRGQSVSKAALSFYDFADITDIKTFRAQYRRNINALPVSQKQENSIILAALSGFEYNVELSKAISRQRV